uniref:Uncharacterized protein n=1 Tax=viral metagenome TaxID=1070528 RepID=A0A6C0AE08_9ZZZZ
MGGNYSKLSLNDKIKLSDFELLLKDSKLLNWKIYTLDSNIKIYVVMYIKKHNDIYIKYTFKNNIIYDIIQIYKIPEENKDF